MNKKFKFIDTGKLEPRNQETENAHKSEIKIPDIKKDWGPTIDDCECLYLQNCLNGEKCVFK